MKRLHNPALVEYARELRNNATPEENKLWYQCLSKMPVRFSRQKIIGNYIVDFYCAAAKLVIELDGAQHYGDEAQQNDRERDAYMASIGLRVLRYTNIEVNKQFEAVCLDIGKYVGI